jgi:hypothetical protein
MPLLTITKSYADGDVLLEADLDAIRNDLITFMNVTKLDSTNLQDNAISTAKIQNSAVTTAKIADNNVTEAKIPITIRSGYIGEVIAFHTFNGTLSIPRGFMKLNGDVVNQTNYDAIHGAGAYVTDGIASSAILSKNLPNATDKYLTGVASTTQDGSAPITYVGNASNQVNLQHTHSIAAHNHQWYNVDSGSSNDESYNSAGTAINLPVTSLNNGTGEAIMTTNRSNGDTYIESNLYTANESLTTNSSGSTTQSIRPHSVEVIYLIKVI